MLLPLKVADIYYIAMLQTILTPWLYKRKLWNETNGCSDTRSRVRVRNLSNESIFAVHDNTSQCRENRGCLSCMTIPTSQWRIFAKISTFEYKVWATPGANGPAGHRGRLVENFWVFIPACNFLIQGVTTRKPFPVCIAIIIRLTETEKQWN